MAATPLYILHVDDFPELLEHYAEYLEWALPSLLQRPVGIVPVVDGASALKQLQQYRFDLVITDLTMRGVSGYTLIRRIRDGETEVGPHSTPRSVPILVCATIRLGETGERMRAEIEGPAADGWVCKPCLGDELADAVLKLLQLSGVVSAPDRDSQKG